jgi:UDPglucose 6-dehydrogenase
MVRRGIGSDPRIGPKFIYPGIGYGGSCFPKDVKALIKTAKEFGYELRVLQAVEAVNEDQKLVLFNKVEKYFDGRLKGKKIAMWGLSFKPQTDDMREAPSLALIERFLGAGSSIRAYDPVAQKEARRILGDRIDYTNDPYDALEGADCLLLVTEWKEFRIPDLQKMRRLLKNPAIFDGRNIYEHQEMKDAGFDYYCIGTVKS